MWKTLWVLVLPAQRSSLETLQPVIYFEASWIYLFQSKPMMMEAVPEGTSQHTNACGRHTLPRKCQLQVFQKTAFLGVEPALTKQIKLSLSPVLQLTFLIGVVAKASQGTQEALKPKRWATRGNSCDDGHSSLTKTTHKWRSLLLIATCLHFLCGWTPLMVGRLYWKK